MGDRRARCRSRRRLERLVLDLSPAADAGGSVFEQLFPGEEAAARSEAVATAAAKLSAAARAQEEAAAAYVQDTDAASVAVQRNPAAAAVDAAVLKKRSATLALYEATISPAALRKRTLRKMPSAAERLVLARVAYYEAAKRGGELLLPLVLKIGIAKLQVAVLRAALRLLPAPSAAADDAAAVWRRRAKSALAVGAVALLALAVFLAGGASVPRFPLSPADGPLSPMRPAPVPPGAGRLPFNSRPFLDNMARKLVV